MGTPSAPHPPTHSIQEPSASQSDLLASPGGLKTIPGCRHPPTSFHTPLSLAAEGCRIGVPRALLVSCPGFTGCRQGSVGSQHPQPASKTSSGARGRILPAMTEGSRQPARQRVFFPPCQHFHPETLRPSVQLPALSPPGPAGGGQAARPGTGYKTTFPAVTQPGRNSP